jgi:hypothetical protein
VVRALACLLVWLFPVLALAGPMEFDRDLGIPPVVADSGAPVPCTITYLIADILTNDTFVMRMRIAATEEARPVRNRMPCPTTVPARLSVRALDVCAIRVEDPNTCVYADMSRGFENDRVGRNTASNGARCRSDQSDFIGLACWKSDTLDVCSVGCGNTEAEAKAQAQARCEDKHQRSCRVTAAAPVLVP